MVHGTRQFRLLGPVAALDDRGDQVALGGTNQRYFLALMLLNPNRVVSLDTAIDAIWGESPPASAVTMVHGYASKLRPIVQPAARLVTRARGYALEIDDRTIDADRFSAHVERGKELVAAGDLDEGRQELDKGLRLWQGAALEDLRYETAIAPYAALLDEQRVAALEERIDVELQLGQDAEPVGELQRLVAANPHRERLLGLLMLALYRSGRQAEATTAYDEFRKRLASELGLSPGRQLEELHAAILRRDLSLGEPVARRPGPPQRRTSRVAIAAAATAAIALAAALVSVAVAYSTRGSDPGLKPLVPTDERLPFAAVPNDLLGSFSATIPAGQSPQTMTLRGSDDAVCKALLGGHGTCFLIHPAANELDPGARGQAAYRNGMIVLRYVRIPFSPSCEREIDRYRVSPDRQQLTLDKRVLVSGPFDDCSFSKFTRPS